MQVIRRPSLTNKGVRHLRCVAVAMLAACGCSCESDRVGGGIREGHAVESLESAPADRSLNEEDQAHRQTPKAEQRVTTDSQSRPSAASDGNATGNPHEGVSGSSAAGGPRTGQEPNGAGPAGAAPGQKKLLREPGGLNAQDKGQESKTPARPLETSWAADKPRATQESTRPDVRRSNPREIRRAASQARHHLDTANKISTEDSGKAFEEALAGWKLVSAHAARDGECGELTTALQVALKRYGEATNKQFREQIDRGLPLIVK